MAVHAGNWPGWYKGMKPSLRPWRTHIQKRGFVCSLSICHFPREKTIQTDLKKRILPYAPAPCVPLIEGLTQPLLIDVDVIILCDNTCTVSRQAMKLKGGRRSLASMLDGQRWGALFEDLLLDRQDLCNCWAMWGKKKKNAASTLVKFIHEWDTAAVTHKNCTTRDHKFDMTMNQSRESDLFLWIIPHLNQNRESDTTIYICTHTHTYVYIYVYETV